MKLIIVIVIGAILLTVLNILLGITDNSLNTWVSRVGYMIAGAAIFWASPSSRRTN